MAALSSLPLVNLLEQKIHIVDGRRDDVLEPERKGSVQIDVSVGCILVDADNAGRPRVVAGKSGGIEMGPQTVSNAALVEGLNQIAIVAEVEDEQVGIEAAPQHITARTSGEQIVAASSEQYHRKPCAQRAASRRPAKGVRFPIVPQQQYRIPAKSTADHEPYGGFWRQIHIE